MNNEQHDDPNTPPQQHGSGLATTALICGIIGLPTCLPAIAALICGIISLAQGRPGKARAIAGVVLGGLGVVFIGPAAIIAAIAIPNLLESRVTANEAAAAATLKSGIFPAQIQFQAGAYQDVDDDNVGEYGTLAQLAGLAPASKVPAGQVHLLQGPAMTGTANGYRFAVWLPDGKGGATSAPSSDPAAADAQEKRFVVYAWPVRFGDTGRRVFALCEDGQLRTRPNLTEATAGAPAWNDLFDGGEWGQARWPIYSR